jgi:hypothetical protein
MAQNSTSIAEIVTAPTLRFRVLRRYFPDFIGYKSPHRKGIWFFRNSGQRKVPKEQDIA